MHTCTRKHIYTKQGVLQHSYNTSQRIHTHAHILYGIHVQHISTLTLCPGSTHTLTHTCSECLNAYYTLSMWQRTAGKVSGNNHSVRHTQKKHRLPCTLASVSSAEQGIQFLVLRSDHWSSMHQHYHQQLAILLQPARTSKSEPTTAATVVEGPAKQLEQQYSIAWHGLL